MLTSWEREAHLHRFRPTFMRPWARHPVQRGSGNDKFQRRKIHAAKRELHRVCEERLLCAEYRLLEPRKLGLLLAIPAAPQGRVCLV